MTVNVNDTVERYTISGTGPYAYSWRIFDEDELVISVLDSGDVDPVTLVIDTHYTVTGANVETGGYITLTAAAVTAYTGFTIDLRSNTVVDQPTSIKNQSTFAPAVHEKAFDRLSRQVQDLSRKVRSAFRYPDNTDLDAVMTARQSWLERYLYVNASGIIEPAIALANTLTQSIFNAFYILTDDHKRTAAEIAAGVTPTDYSYPEGYVLRYGADNTGVADSSAAIARAILVGKAVIFSEGTYLANNLSQTANFQRFYAIGTVNIKKNANGPIITSSGDNVDFNGIGFRGDASSPVYTGNNIVSSGDYFSLINCGSRWAYERAVLATGNAVQIVGQCDVYQTTDATSNGYDIEIGVSGTATLYHKIIGIGSSQSTGGIKLIDVGSHSLSDSQFGKLFIDAGTSPAGVNGGKTSGCRITGDVTVELSSAIFVANQFGSSTDITFALGTSGCSLDTSNIFSSGSTVTNNGNANNLIIRNISTGSYITLKYGDDSSLATMRIDPASGEIKFGAHVTLANNKSLRWDNAAATNYASITMTSGNNWSISNAYGAIQFSAASPYNYQFANIPTGAGGLGTGAIWSDSGAIQIT